MYSICDNCIIGITMTLVTLCKTSIYVIYPGSKFEHQTVSGQFGSRVGGWGMGEVGGDTHSCEENL